MIALQCLRQLAAWMDSWQINILGRPRNCLYIKTFMCVVVLLHLSRPRKTRRMIRKGKAPWQKNVFLCSRVWQLRFFV